jgi:dTDP-4-dehydrorhamnose 3,5-epimerase
MQIVKTDLTGVFIFEPEIFKDKRGYFYEAYNARDFPAQIGLVDMAWAQDNHSYSKPGVVRGIHYQVTHPQGKLVRVLSGEIFDFAVDLRKISPSFGQWIGVHLSAENKRQLWVPPGFGHGFCVPNKPGFKKKPAEVLYKVTNFQHTDCERCIVWNDPDLAIDWPVTKPILSDKDKKGSKLKDAEVYE